MASSPGDPDRRAQELLDCFRALAGELQKNTAQAKELTEAIDDLRDDVRKAIDGVKKGGGALSLARAFLGK